MQKKFCAVNSQLLFHENSFDFSPKNAFEQRLFRGSGSVHAPLFDPYSINIKNIVRMDLKRVKKIKIGDKSYSPDESFDRKNIVGNVENADEFILGDGH